MLLVSAHNSERNVELVCVGSAVVDIVFQGLPDFPKAGCLQISSSMSIHPGGGATNTCIAFARLGGSSALIACLGQDRMGRIVLHSLTESGAQFHGTCEPTVTTSTTAVLVSDRGERRFICHPGGTRMLSPQIVDQALLSRSSALHVADVFLLGEGDGTVVLAVLEMARQAGCLTSMGLCWDPSDRWIHSIEASLPMVDILFCNAEESQRLTGSTRLEEAGIALQRRGPRIVVITQGKDGSMIFGMQGSPMAIPAIETTVIDTTGAGDCYAAGFLYAYLRRWPPHKVAQLATQLATQSVSFVGGTTGIQPIMHSF